MFVDISEAQAVEQLRNEPRMKVLLSGTLRSRRGLIGCRVVDISRGGACLDLEGNIEAGESVTFERDALKVPGTIIWSRGHRVGLRFGEPIRATALFIQMSQSRQAQKPSGPGVTKPSLSSPPRRGMPGPIAG